MPGERITVSITTRQKEQVSKQRQYERLPTAENLRRALDASFAWDDPTYPLLPMPGQGTLVHLLNTSQGFFEPFPVNIIHIRGATKFLNSEREHSSSRASTCHRHADARDESRHYMLDESEQAS